VSDTVTVAVPERYELRTTLRVLSLGRGDRTIRFLGPDTAWRATRTPDGPGTACYRHRPRDHQVEVDAFGPGAGWLLQHAADLLGADDDLAGFEDLANAHTLVARLHRERPGIRFGRSGNLFECLVPTICAQKVTGLEAARAWRGIVFRWGEWAPGPMPGLRVPPAPQQLADAGYEQFHRMGLERRRADLIRTVARDADRLQTAVDTLTPHDAEVRLRTIPGIGIWTAAKVRHTVMGDPDAVPYGDYHLPSAVSWTLLGQRDGTDELMYELLEPFAPHRGRVVRLVEVAGEMAPRRGPRMAPNGMRHR
jgi:3-methyladenine DNA glycosylase/8-oxoguanine DNA glycosylase